MDTNMCIYVYMYVYMYTCIYTKALVFLKEPLASLKEPLVFP